MVASAIQQDDDSYPIGFSIFFIVFNRLIEHDYVETGSERRWNHMAFNFWKKENFFALEDITYCEMKEIARVYVNL